MFNLNSTPERSGISFIIPCYNCEITLVEAIRSIMNLKLSNFEICMVDDGSTDNTYNLMLSLNRHYGEVIKIGRNKENMGGAYTRNKCVLLSKYDWFFMLDSDNYLHKKSFYKLLSKISKEDDVLTFQKIYFFYDFLGLDLVFRKWIFKKDRMVFEDLKRTGCHPVADGNYLLRRSVFKKIGGYDDEKLHVNLDSWSLGYRILLNDYYIKIVRNSHYFHRAGIKSYFIRNFKNYSINLKNLLLKNPQKFSLEEIEKIKKSNNTQETLISIPNDFSIDNVSLIYKVLLRIYKKFKK